MTVWLDAGLEETPATRDCVIFDGDNTLWQVEALYNDARKRFCDALEELGVTRSEVDAFQRRRDAELYGTYGYSPERFPRSFVDTLRHFIPAAGEGTALLVDKLARSVFKVSPKAYEDVDAVLEKLSTSHQLVLFTAGDEDIQRARVQAFGRAHHFSHVKIVPSKSANAFRALLVELNLDAGRTWMVGDSLNSDILPATQAGLRAVYLKADNWSPVEQGDAVVPADVPTANCLSDLLRLILSPSVNSHR